MFFVKHVLPGVHFVCSVGRQNLKIVDWIRSPVNGPCEQVLTVHLPCFLPIMHWVVCFYRSWAHAREVRIFNFVVPNHRRYQKQISKSQRKIVHGDYSWQFQILDHNSSSCFYPDQIRKEDSWEFKKKLKTNVFTQVKWIQIWHTAANGSDLWSNCRAKCTSVHFLSACDDLEQDFAAVYKKMQEESGSSLTHLLRSCDIAHGLTQKRSG